MKKQAGWTLLEMVLTMSLMAILLGGIGLSIIRPIQDVFFLNTKVGILKPMHLAFADLRQSFEKASQLSLNEEKTKLSIRTNNQIFQYTCQDNQLQVSLRNNKRPPGVLLYGYDCHFNLFEQPDAWVVMLYVMPEAQVQTTQRIFYVAKEGI